MGLPPLKYIAVTERGKGRMVSPPHHRQRRDRPGYPGKHVGIWLRKLPPSAIHRGRACRAGELHRKVSRWGKAWTASKNLVDPEPRTRDGRISGSKARELAKSLESGEKFAKFESLYPGYLMSAAEAFHNDVNGGCYLVTRFYRKDRKFIRPKQKPKRKRKKREGGKQNEHGRAARRRVCHG